MAETNSSPWQPSNWMGRTLSVSRGPPGEPAKASTIGLMAESTGICFRSRIIRPKSTEMSRLVVSPLLNLTTPRMNSSRLPVLSKAIETSALEYEALRAANTADSCSLSSIWPTSTGSVVDSGPVANPSAGVAAASEPGDREDCPASTSERHSRAVDCCRFYEPRAWWVQPCFHLHMSMGMPKSVIGDLSPGVLFPRTGATSRVTSFFGHWPPLSFRADGEL